jgi:site-specific DNA-methyltransferase (adenine-specific)
MIIPSRWFSGGRGLDEFRDEMLKDDRIREIHDFLNASDCFPGVEIKGGVCYFLWNRDDKGLCKIFTHDGNKNVSISERGLLEKNTDTFVRYNEAISILRKVQSLKEDSFANIISANDPFGFDIRENNSYKRVKPSFKKVEFENAVEFYYNGWKKEGLGYIKKDSIQKNISWIKDYKILIPKAWGVGIMDKDWLNPFIIGNNSCCTETYLIIGPFVDDKKAQRVIDYTQTKFFHFLVSLIKNTQNAMKKVYQFVPMQNFNEKWTDEKLFKKYNLTTEEINFIESMIRPMDITQNSEVDE